MTSTIEAKLEFLANHAVWTRDAKWLRHWYDSVFVPVCAEGLIPPPLAALDLCSSMDRGMHREGRQASGREGYNEWCDFLGSINASVKVSLSEQRSLNSLRQGALAHQALRAFTLSLMSREWMIAQKYWNKSGEVVAQQLLGDEVARLSNGSTNEMLNQIWAVLDLAAVQKALHNFLPPGVWVSLKNRNIKAVDPFLFPLLGLQAAGEAMRTPAIQGSKPHAIHTRRRLGATGDFAKRDLGQLPSNLARLAPTELMLFAEAAESAIPKPNGKSSSKRERAADGKFAKPSPLISAAALRSLFIMKTSEGRLLQRFSHEAEPSVMEPMGMLQVEIADDTESHLLPINSDVPTISWFRAVAVHLIHCFARFAASARWGLCTAFTYSFNHRVSTGLISSNYREVLAESVSNTLDLLVATNPRAFQAGWPGLGEQLPPENLHPQEMDYCLRIVLGSPDSWSELPSELLVRPRQQWSARVEKAVNGRWGVAHGNEIATAQALAVLDVDQTEAQPEVVAEIIVNSIFDQMFAQTGGAS
jgi:hypothetical protein